MRNQRRTYLITGGSGFIGAALCRHLAQKPNITVLAIGRRQGGAGRRQGGAGRRMPSKAVPNYHRMDLLNKKLLRTFLQCNRPDFIFHMAGGRSGDISQLFCNNVLTTINLLETIRSLEGFFPRVIIPGTAAEYGEVPGLRRPISEKVPTQPMGLYGWVKLLQTQTALHYAALGQDIIIARLFNVLGEGIREDLAPGKFARDIVALEKSSQPGILSVSNLDGVRDFLDIRDICEALYILSSKGEPGEIYNICSGKGTVMREFLAGMIKTSRRPGIKVKENKKAKPGVIYAVGSNVKFRHVTGWRPKYHLSQSILDTLAFYRQRHEAV